MHGQSGGNGRKKGGGSNNNNNRGVGAAATEKKPSLVLSQVDTGAMLQNMAIMPTPQTVYILPLTLNPVFGGTSYYALVDRRTLERMQDLQAKGDLFLGLFLQKDPNPNVKVADVSQLYQVGQLGCAIGAVQYTSNPDVHLLQITPLSRRIRIKAPVPGAGRENDATLLAVEIEELIEGEYDRKDPVIRTNHEAIVSAIQQLHEHDPSSHYQKLLDEMDPENPAEFVDLAAAVMTSEPEMQQAVLETTDVKQRQLKCLELLHKKLEVFKKQKDVRMENMEQEAKLEAAQKKLYLERKKKAIEKELKLDVEDSDKLIEDFKKKLETLQVPEEAMHVINEEMNKLTSLERSSSEYNITRTYLNWLTTLPWGLHSKENLNLSHAISVLNEDHFGLKDIKERILEFIAVGNLKGSVQGKILCFVGPPGVGKTSIGQSIARALDREFFRFSVGGMSDVSEIKGHRRTYVGAMPGKIVQSMKNLKSANPVILIDEIDKMGNSRQGDPASALLEVLDPEQNKTFLDHYLDVPFDLSKVLFVCTANVSDTIPGPLLDRMEVIQLSGYILEEKMNIAKKYLVPQIMKDSGLQPGQIAVNDSALHALIQSYAREAGVRELYKHIEKIFRKVAYKVAKERKPAPDATEATPAGGDGAEKPKKRGRKTKKPSKADEEVGKETKSESEGGDGQTQPVVITASNLTEFVGQPKFTSDRFYDVTPPGVVMGLAWTAMGGATLYIETVNDRPLYSALKRSQPAELEHAKEGDAEGDKDRGVKTFGGAGGAMRLLTTGQMGSVMQESTSIAFTFARNFLEDVSPRNEFFDRAALHMHIPEGATPKDGPSAGCTMVTSLLSLATGRPVPPDIAMTGEITLTGKILTIGGVKEKTIAARRSGVKRLFFPDGNRKDWEELPDYIREGLEARFVKDYRQIYDVIFADSDPAASTTSSTTTVIDGETTTSTTTKKPRATRRRKPTDKETELL